MSESVGNSELQLKQSMEVEVLELIYIEDLKKSASNSYEISLEICDKPCIPPICLEFTLKDDYPMVPAVFSFKETKGKWFSKERRASLIAAITALHDPEDDGNLLKAIYWLKENAYTELNLSDIEEKELETMQNPKQQSAYSNQPPHPTIYHSWVLSDRKSKFQAHFARFTSRAEAGQVIDRIQSDPKFSKATHPCIFAWSISGPTEGEIDTESKDDGEGGASQYLVHFLETKKVVNACLMVTRWYGGINLGPDRFRHISSISEVLLDQLLVNNLGKELPKGSYILEPMLKAIQEHSVKHKDVTLRVHFQPANGHTNIQAVEWSAMISQPTKYPLHFIESVHSKEEILIWSRRTNSCVIVAAPK